MNTFKSIYFLAGLYVCSDNKNTYLISIKAFVYWSLNPFKSEPVVNVKFHWICLLYVMDMLELMNREKYYCSEKEIEVCYYSYDVCSVTGLKKKT